MECFVSDEGNGTSQAKLCLSFTGVDKYKPTSLSQLVGQQTEKSPMKKLIYFLTNWHTWHATAPTSKKRKATASFPAVSSTDPSKYRGVLLIGPPGSGQSLFVFRNSFNNDPF
jgi:replication factor C subunit 1